MAIVIMIVSEWVQSMRWLLMIACMAAAVAFVVAAGGYRLVWAAVCVVMGLGAVWGFNLQAEEDNRPAPEILYARELLVDLAKGNAAPCRSMPEEEQRRLAERYQAADCPTAAKAIEDSIDGVELERLKEITGTPLETRRLPGEENDDPTALYSVRLDENPLGWKEIDFTVVHPDGFLKAVR
ncbi:hypothetical protein [Nonomuraea sp. B19D2]|uniref:hypothetical protein n=1 Tax=Nonomuraea sp. B19D2 TaxID=3159561 RepID=UPI0032DBB97A